MTAMVEWKCSGCGAVSKDRVRSCDCPTVCLFSGPPGNMVHSTKLPTKVEQRALSTLRKAIIDNTKGDLFWIGEILLAELEKETGFAG